MTKAEYIESLMLRASRGTPQETIPVTVTGAEASLDAALDRLAERVADSEKRALLQKEFTINLTSGDGTIPTTAVVAAIPKCRLMLSGVTQPLQHVPYYDDMLYPVSLSDYHYYTLEENKIKVRTSVGGTPTVGTVVTGYLNYIPLVTEVPTVLEDTLVLIGIELVTETVNLGKVAAEANQV